MASMPPSSPTDRLAAGFSPAPLPPVAADGSLALEPAPITALPVRPLSLCELGPCRNYHRLVNQIDAQSPLDGSEAAVHIGVSRTCYPSAGTEMELEAAVRECSRWEPMTNDELTQLQRRRARFEMPHGADHDEYKAFEASWKGATMLDDDNANPATPEV